MYKVKENKLVAAGGKCFTSNHHDLYDILLHVGQSVNSGNVRKA